MTKRFHPIVTKHTAYWDAQGKVIRGYQPPPHYAAHRAAFEALFQSSQEGGEGEPYFVSMAQCLLWTGPCDTRRGTPVPYFNFRGFHIQAQRFAYELYIARIPQWDYVAGVPCKTTVPRCTAANNKLCVSRDHLQPVRAKAPFWVPTTLEQRLEIRALFAPPEDRRDERYPAEELATKFKLPLARIYRIVTRIEGDRDPRQNHLKLVKSDFNS